MSQHSSLKGADVSTRHRNVLKRHERIKSLRQDDKWGTRETAYKLPKMKLLKIKVKKTKIKAEGETAAGGAAGATPPAAGAGASKSATKTAAK